LLLAVWIQLAGPYYQVGIASWYGPGFHGRQTANGETYDMNGISAAHKSLPFGTVVRVVELETGRSVDVRINDRGPFVEGRIIDLSRGAAQRLGIVDKGITRVGLRILSWPR
ncbi:MAG: septal ring lytic transglycosylase RlpA family protein, partial [Candidatus Bipolaricaulota bacterium]